MKIKKSLINWLMTGGVDETDPQLYMRVLFANALMYVVGLVLLAFTVFHFLFSKNYLLAIFDLAGFLLLLVVYLHLRIKKSITLSGHVSAIGMTVFYLNFIPVTQNENFSFIWVFLAPLLYIMLNGWRVGGAYLLLLFAFIFPMAYNNIGVWEGGNWSAVHAYRFVVGLLLVTAVAVLVDVTQQIANKREKRIRNSEQSYVGKLKRLSITDSLTGLYNRRHFNEVFAQKVKALQNNNHDLLFFIIDIDFFKAYNDYFGHQAGDEVIKQIAKAIKKYVQRENDLVFRLGGEEFGGLIETRDKNETKLWLLGLNQVIRDLNIKHAAEIEMPVVTISGGMSAIDSQQGDMKSLYKKADDALYQAKDAGRDCFMCDFTEHARVMRE